VIRRCWPVIAIAAAIAAIPASALGAGFRYGVTAADATQHTALVWTRAPKKGRVVLDVSRTRRFRHGATHRRLRARASHDRTVRAKLRKLRAGTRYFYRFRQGKRRSAVGRFVTAPRPTSRRKLRFAFSGDADAQPSKGKSKPFWGNFAVYRAMAKEGNAFNINLGDTIYSDSEVDGRIVNNDPIPGFPLARTLRQKWQKYRMNLGQRNLRTVRARASMYNVWDDHEFVNDFSVATDGRALFNSGARAFGDYMPVTRSKRKGIYRRVRWGRNAELFFLDERSFRSPKLSASSICDNPQSHNYDIAPTAPQYIRDQFALVYPPLAEPVSPKCLAAIRDPRRTMLGAAQLKRFRRALAHSKARWKIVVNEVSMQQKYVFPYDNWEGYEADRQRVLRALSKVKNAVVLTTDEHATLFNDVRFQTLEPGGVKNSGVKELITGPVGTATLKDEFDEAIRPGTTDLLRSIFYKPKPPEGVGMKCAAIDTYSYAEVEVTARRLVLRPKDARGRQLYEEGSDGKRGPKCGPFKLKAR